MIRWPQRWLPAAVLTPLALALHFAFYRADGVYPHVVHVGPWLVVMALLGAAPGRWTLAAYHVLFSVPVQVIFYIDGIVYTNYRTHFNGAILRMLLTPGVEDLFEFSLRDYFKLTVLVLVAVGLVTAAAWGLSVALRRLPKLGTSLGRYLLFTVLAVVGITLVEKALYAWSDLRSRRDVLVNARVIPFYLPATCKHIARNMGMKVDRQYQFGSSLALNYPRAEVAVPKESPKYNVVWIAVEGWRADALVPEVSPRLSRFGKKCLVAERHYSSGNCTRFGIFGMFYGLDAFYWQAFLAERQGPLLIKLLKDMNYDFLVMGAANFRNPEFRLSCFVDLADEQVIHGRALGRKSYDRDLTMSRKFEEFLAARDGSRPFFFFAFLDSTHSPYKWKKLPDFSPPFSGYEKKVRHERLAGDAEERRQAFIRYKNSAAYVDHLIGGMVADLERRGLLEKTIVMISGDHSEEFGENGFFGHNGSFDDYQLVTPFLFHYPGVKPGRIKAMTSHVDMAPTTLRLLGVTEPPASYCQGLDLRGELKRSYVVAGSYSSAAVIVDDGHRLVFPIEGYRISTVDVFDSEYREPPDREAVLRRHVGKLGEVLKASGLFKK
jgi:membrane-anchored protein YejM (alkaline phosphatase superfamily)